MSVGSDQQVVRLCFRRLCYFTPLSGGTLSRGLLLPMPVIATVGGRNVELNVLRRYDKNMKLARGKGRCIRRTLKFGKVSLYLCHQLTRDRRTESTCTSTLDGGCHTTFSRHPMTSMTLSRTRYAMRATFHETLLYLTGNALANERVMYVNSSSFIDLTVKFLLGRLCPNPDVYPARVRMLRVSNHCVRYLRQLTKQFTLPVDYRQISLEVPLPPRLYKHFSYLFASPPCARRKTSLFLSHTVDMLGRRSKLEVFFSFKGGSTARICFLRGYFRLRKLTVGRVFAQFGRCVNTSLLNGGKRLFILRAARHAHTLFPLRGQKHSSVCATSHGLQRGHCHYQRYNGICTIKGRTRCRAVERLGGRNYGMYKTAIFSELRGGKGASGGRCLPLKRRVLTSFCGYSPRGLSSIRRVHAFVRRTTMDTKTAVMRRGFRGCTPINIDNIIIVRRSRLAVRA